MAICIKCLKKIPNTRKISSKYCGDKCYYEAKKERSKQRYSALKELSLPFNLNEILLDQVYPFIERNQPISYAMLDNLGFNWGISQGQGVTNEKDIWQLIGKYYYKINIDKTISICKASPR